MVSKKLCLPAGKEFFWKIDYKSKKNIKYRFYNIYAIIINSNYIGEIM